MTTDFLHGVEVVTVADGPRPVQTQRSSVIGLIGTAPDADATVFPLNTPVLVNSRGGYSTIGATGTLPDALSGIFAQFGAFVVVIRVDAGADDAEALANVIGSTSDMSGVNSFRKSENLLGLAPMILIAPGFTSLRPTGVTSIAVGTPGSGYTSAPTVAFSGGGGTGAAGTAVLTNGVSLALGVAGTGYTSAPTVTIDAPPTGGVQATATAAVSGGLITGFTVTNPGKGYVTAPNVTIGGPGSGGTAVATLTGRVGSVTITNPGQNYTGAPAIAFSGGAGTGAAATATTGSGPNPVVSALLTVANMMRAHIIADGPNTTDSAAIAYRGDWDDRRVYIVDPEVMIFNSDPQVSAYEPKPASSRVAGLIAQVDFNVGFWKSPSNEVINGVGGLSRTVDWALGDPNSIANLLNENDVATFIRDDGWRLWGNRTTSTDPRWSFLSVSRTADLIDISIQTAHRSAVDQVINRGYYDDVISSVNGYLRQLRAQGAILGGVCYIDPDFNTPEDIAAGHATFSYDFTPPTPAERVTFRSKVTDAFISTIFANQ